MMSTTPLELELEIDYTSKNKISASESSYSCIKTELSLSLPGSDDSNPALELSLFDQHNPKGYSFINLKTSSNKGEIGFASTDGKWGYYGGSESEQGKRGAALISNGAGEVKDMDIDVAALNSQKSALENKHVNATATAPAAKAQVVGWPPIRSFRKNSVVSASTKNSHEAEEKLGFSCLYVKVSMDGAPYLRKVDLKLYKNYKELSFALKNMFSSFPGKDGLGGCHLNDMPQGSDCVLTYEDKDGDWMLVGDVPWDMFISTCKRMRIMKGSEAVGLAPRGMEN